MIQLIPSHVEPYPGHHITCTKSIGTFIEGETYHAAMQKCTGRKFKNSEDHDGSPEDRYMIFSMYGVQPAYAIDKKEVLDECFEENNKV